MGGAGVLALWLLLHWCRVQAAVAGTMCARRHRRRARIARAPLRVREHCALSHGLLRGRRACAPCTCALVAADRGDRLLGPAPDASLGASWLTRLLCVRTSACPLRSACAMAPGVCGQAATQQVSRLHCVRGTQS